ncbi:hypothetical protein AYK24_03660 [Thermoplasmatales archaeon SG8-52-4]|nr:MAG: hypothetical protein AYK24_03660 [Thermoplasmatales archaeon SG8-52-4]
MMLNRKCKNCLISESYSDVKLNENKICNFCTTLKKDNDEEKRLMKKEFEEYIYEIKGKNVYDCVLLFSGGKDSIYLLYLLTKKYGLNVLTVTVDNDLETNLSKENIKKCIKFFNVNNLTVIPRNDFYKRLYKYIFKNKIENGYSMSICPICFGIINCIGLNIAAKKKIPIVLDASSPDQIRSGDYLNKNLLKKLDSLNVLENPDFIKQDLNYFWDPKKYDIIPRFIKPFYFLEYPGVENIIKKLESLGLGQKKKFNPLSTNCHMSWLSIYLDLKKYNDNMYIRNFHKLVRYGKINRLKWRIMLPIGIFLLKNRLIKRKQINQAVKYIDLKLEDLL